MTILQHIEGYRSRIINALIDRANTQRIVPSADIIPSATPGGTALALTRRAYISLGWPYGSHFAFGLAIAGADVTIYPGAIELGATFYLSSATTKTITGLGQYLGLECNRSSGSTTITGPHDSRPVSEDDIYRTPLFIFDLVDGIAVLSRECINDIRLEAIL